MTSPQFKTENIQRAMCAELVDILSIRFHKHADFQTQSGWSAGTVLSGDMGLSLPEIEACAVDIEAFFGLPAGQLSRSEDATIGAWAQTVATGINSHFSKMTFSVLYAEGEKYRSRTVDEIIQDAQAAADLFPQRSRIVSFVPANQLLGFILTVVYPEILQIDAVEGLGVSPLALRDMLRSGDLIVATPTMWRYLVQALDRVADNIIGASFGERLPSELEENMRALGVSAVRELYGATETGLVGWRDSTTEPFCLLPHWTRAASETNETYELIRRRPDEQEAVVAAMDVLVWDSDRLFTLVRRRDNAVQVGGVNVHPDRIAGVIETHPYIEGAKIRVHFQRDGACRLIAHMTLKDGQEPHEETMRDIDHWCRKRLRPSERPRLYSFEPSAEALERL